MRSRLIKALNNRFYVKFMELEIGLLHDLIVTKLCQNPGDRLDLDLDLV